MCESACFPRLRGLYDLSRMVRARNGSKPPWSNLKEQPYRGRGEFFALPGLFPHACLSYAPLELPRVFADQEGQIFGRDQNQLGFQAFLDSAQCVAGRISQPVFAGGKFFEPSVRRRKNHMPIRSHQTFDFPQQIRGTRYSINQVSCQNQIKSADMVWSPKGVGHEKAALRTVELRIQFASDGRGTFALF